MLLELRSIPLSLAASARLTFRSLYTVRGTAGLSDSKRRSEATANSATTTRGVTVGRTAVASSEDLATITRRRGDVVTCVYVCSYVWLGLRVCEE